MTTINLSQSVQQGPLKKTSFIDKGIFTSLVILVITLIIFGGLKLWTSRLQSQQAAIKSQTAEEVRGLEGSEVDQVVDFYERLGKIDQNIAPDNNPAGLLKQVETIVIPGSIITSLEFSEGSLSLKISTDNFVTAAKQLLAFKKSSGFSNVKIVEITRNNEGRIDLSLAMQTR